MLYLLIIPIVFLAVIVKLVSNRYKLKVFSKICTIIIVIGVLLFIYLFAEYHNYSITQYIFVFLKPIMNS